MLPKARTDKLLATEVDDEIVVYDLIAQRAHNLNPTAAFVWRKADGSTTVEAMASALAEELGAPATEDVVWLALEGLEEVGLLAEPLNRPEGVSRRQAMLKIAAVGAAMVPVIRSIAAPTAAMALSGDQGNGLGSLE